MFNLRLRSSNPKKGSIAILLVLMMIGVISTIAVQIASRAQSSASVVVNRRDHAKAYELAKAAFRWSVMRLQLDSSLDKIPAIPGTNFGGKKDDLNEMQWTMPLPYPFPMGGSTVLGTSPEQQLEALGGSFVSNITDESSKINLNDVGSGGPGTLKKWSGPAEILENLLLSHRFKPFVRDTDHRELLWAIDDWVDSDSNVNHTAGGLEDTAYALDLPNYTVKNAPLYTLGELRLMKVMNEAFFQELKPFVTVYPFNARLPRVSTTPVPVTGKINVNTASMEIIAALFNRQALPNLTARLECAKLVVTARQLTAFKKTDEFKKFLGAQCGGALDQSQGSYPIISKLVEPVLDVRSDIFHIEAIGNAGKAEKTVMAVVSRKDPKKVQILYWRVI